MPLKLVGLASLIFLTTIHLYAHPVQLQSKTMCASTFSVEPVKLPTLTERRSKSWSTLPLNDLAVEIIKFYKLNRFATVNRRLSWQGPQLPPYLKGFMLPFEDQIDRKDSPLSPLTPFEKLLTLQFQLIEGNTRLKYDLLVNNGPLFKELDFFERQLADGSSASIEDIHQTLGRIESALKNLTTLSLPEFDSPAEVAENGFVEGEEGWPSGGRPFSSRQLTRLLVKQVNANFALSDEDLKFVEGAYQSFLTPYENRVWRDIVQPSQTTTKGVLLLLIAVPLSDLKKMKSREDLQRKGLEFVSTYRSMLVTHFARTFYHP